MPDLRVILLGCLGLFLFYPSTDAYSSNFKSLRFRVEASKRYPHSNYFPGVIVFRNIGNDTISFWEDINNYSMALGFWTGSVIVVHNETYNWEKKWKKSLPPQHVYLSKVIIKPHSVIRKRILIYVCNKKIFMKNSKNLRSEFKFYDTDADYFADIYRPSIISDNCIQLKW